MDLENVPHRVIAYRTFGMDGVDNPFLWPVVSCLAIEDGAEQVLLFYNPPTHKRDWHHLAKAAVEAAAGAAATGWVLDRTADESQRSFVRQHASGMLGRLVAADIQKAFDHRRGEGYYRADDPRVRYYDEIIQARSADRRRRGP